MQGDFPFQSTQAIGARIRNTINKVCWEDFPEDCLVLKEYEENNPADIAPIDTKPTIKSTLRQFWELREESCDDEDSGLSRKVNDMELERPQEEEQPATDIPDSHNHSKKTTPSTNEPGNNNDNLPAPSQFNTERKKKIILTRNQDTGRSAPHTHTQVQPSQYSQNPSYAKKLAEALGEPKSFKGKSKLSQRISYAPSTSFMERKKRQAEMSQMSMAIDNIEEDIEDLEDVAEEGVFVSGLGKKKIKFEVEVGRVSTQKAVDVVAKYVSDGKDSLKDKDSGRERGLQDTLDKAVKRASNQASTKWLIKVLSYKTSKGIHTVEFICITPSPEGKNSCYAIINPGKQYYAQTIVPERKYFFVNPRPIIRQDINNKKVYYVDKIEEAVNCGGI